MGSINLYKIDATRVTELIRELGSKMRLKATTERTITAPNNRPETFGLSLYLAQPNHRKDLVWSWVLDEFNLDHVQTIPAPKAVILVEREDGSTYAVTFGSSFFSVDKFCDRNFGFDFARRLDYKEIKTTTLTTPNSQRNKTVNTYINYNELEFDSGESFAKLKVKVALPEGFTLYKPIVEIGNSIKFVTLDDSLEQIVNLVAHVTFVIESRDETCKIPVFSRVKNEDLISRLNENLRIKIESGSTQINISELDIIGVTEVFNNNDGEFELRYGRKAKRLCSLTERDLRGFCEENRFNYEEVVLDIGVVSYYDDTPIATRYVKDIIDYTDDAEHCLLSKGIWYKFNDDYISYLEASIAELDTEYNPSYDFTNTTHDAFIADMFESEKEDDAYQGLGIEEIKKKISNKYYAERAFNLIRARDDGFTNYDRSSTRINNTSLEVMDLYKDEAMITVKIGNTSSKLCYAVDQSLTALKLYKKGDFPDIPKISKAVLWFVLERSEHIEDETGRPDLNKLDMLLLKNRLDNWKKEVRLLGIKPLVYINYRVR